MLQPRPDPAIPFAERLRTDAGRRTLGLGFALLVEVLLLLALLTLGPEEPPRKKEASRTVVDLTTEPAPEEAREAARPEPEQRTEERPAPQPSTADKPRPPQPVEPRPAPTPPPAPPTPPIQPPPAITAPTPARPAPPSGRVYGPPDKGGSSLYRDSERVGTAPNGQPLYAAAWYREPGEAELRAYLSTARGPGWGLIACRTAPDYRVEDCVALDEYPQGSQINRAILAAAWEFKVRPPRLGGKPLVGSWVRIRIDYRIGRR